MDTTTPKPFVFVLMPFDPEFDDVYQLGIKPACSEAGTYAERVDEQLFTESILDRIYNQIAKADVIVSDMTGRNPNVFYETGYAHALGKKVILLTKNLEDIPFDLKHYPHIVYAGRITDLRSELERKIRWAIQQPKAETSYHNIQFFVDGRSLLSEKEVTWPVESFPASSFRLVIDVHNSTEKQITAGTFRIGILSHDKHVYAGHPYGRDSRFKQPDGQELCLLDDTFHLNPGLWVSAKVGFYTSEEPLKEADLVSATLRLFAEGAVVDFPFRIVLVKAS